ncbi:MAG TPA: hypothetical protein VFE62_09760, partial [Gemmataceae bacterium]|nr:hypothetical protein [Gemmataceae bacterium]
MKPRFCASICFVIPFMLLGLSACNRKKQAAGPPPPAQPKQVEVTVAKLRKPENKSEVRLPEPIPPVKAPEPMAPEMKSAWSKPGVEVGRSSITQAEEPAIKTPDLNGWDPLVADCAWYRALKQDISKEAADPDSDRMLGRLLKGKGHIDAQWSGSWTPADWGWHTIPFQVVRGDTPFLSLPGTWAYMPAFQGPYMLPPEPIVHENSNHTRYATEKWKGSDHHLLIYVRDESTGGLRELWEYYQPWV